MHWFRDGNRQRSRILYVFRTPGGVRVGRDPLEPEVLRQLEAQHPDIAFDWKGDPRATSRSSSPRSEQRRRRPKSDAGRDRRARRQPRPPRHPAQAVRQPVQPTRRGRRVRSRFPRPLRAPRRTSRSRFSATGIRSFASGSSSASATRPRRDALLALAERLNPSAWTDADQITAGLQQAAEALERLSRVFAAAPAARPQAARQRNHRHRHLRLNHPDGLARGARAAARRPWGLGRRRSSSASTSWRR